MRLAILYCALLLAAGANALEEGFPVALVIQGGFRPNIQADVTLYDIAIRSYMYALFEQHGLQPHQIMHGTIWLDSSSFDGQHRVLSGMLANLEQLLVGIHSRYPFLRMQIKFNKGMAEGYRTAMLDCIHESSCRYIVFLEEDWQLEHEHIVHSQQELVALFDQHDWINYLRFNKRPLKAWVSDAPCTLDDMRIQSVPVVNTGGFSNNAHMLRPEVMLELFELTNDLEHATHNWGVECHADNTRMGLHSLCHKLVYECLDSHHNDLRACNMSVHDRCGYTETAQSRFHQLNQTACLDAANHSPNFDACGLYMYGNTSSPASASHLIGGGFNVTRFWENPVSLMTQKPLPYYSSVATGI